LAGTDELIFNQSGTMVSVVDANYSIASLTIGSCAGILNLSPSTAGITLNVVSSVSDLSSNAVNISVPISGGASLTSSGGGGLTLYGGNSYSGGTSISNSGTLVDGACYSFSSNSAISLTTGASLGVNYNEAIYGLSGDCSTTVSIGGGSNLLTNGSGSTYAGSISGGGSLEIGSGGYQILTGANNYSDGTRIDCMATLQLGSGGTTGSITGSVTDNGTLAFDLSSCTTFCGPISGSGGVTVQDGMVTLMGSNCYSGVTSVTSSARLDDGESNSFSPNSAIALTNGASLGIGYDEVINGLSGDCSTTVCIGEGSNLLTNGTSAAPYAGVISGNGSFEIGSYGYQILTGANSYSGGTTIDCMATLQLGNDGTTGSIEGCVFNNGTLAFNISNCTTFCGTISGMGAVTVENGMVTLMGDNSYTGRTTLDAGTTLNVTNNNSIGGGLLVTSSSNSSPTVLAASGGCVALSNDVSVGGSGLTLNFSDSPKLTLTGTISNAGSYDSLIINGPVDLEGCNTYSGGTTINEACVTIGTNTGLGTGAVTAYGSNLNFTSSSPQVGCGSYFAEDTTANFCGNATLAELQLCESTLNFNGSCATLADMVSDSCDSGNAINLASETQLTFSESSDTETKFHGNIVGSDGGGSVVVSGSGMVDLYGSNSYGGGTTVEGGLLVASSCSALGTGSVQVNGGAALGVDSNVTICNPVTLECGSGIGGFGTYNSSQCFIINNGTTVVGGAGTLGSNVGSDNIVGTLSFGSSSMLTLGCGGNMQFSIMNAGGAAGTDYSTINVAGTLDITATPGSPFTIQLISVCPGNGQPGYANFNSSLSYQWILVGAGTIAGSFNPNAFQVNLGNFQNPTNGGLFFVTDSSNQLLLNFTPVPEPSTWALMAGGLFTLVAVAYRHRRQA